MKLDSEFIKLPLKFDIDRLVEEASQFREPEWRPHPMGFKGNSALVLISRDGGLNDDMAGKMAPTPYLARCPYIRQVIATFESVFGRSRLMRLDGGCEVSEHSDIDYHWYNRVRIHVPIITYPEVKFYCGDKCLHMAAGEAWIFDSWKMHRVENGSHRQRIHLVADTSGSPAFWDMVRRAQAGNAASTEAKFIPFEHGKDVSIATENYNAAVVMSPGEVDALTLDLLDDLSGVVGAAADDMDLFRRLVNDFRWAWRSLWSQHGISESGFPAYRKLLDSVSTSASRVRSPLYLSSNQASAVEVLHTRVLYHALNPQYADLYTVRQQADAVEPDVSRLAEKRAEAESKVSRNAPCPCGSGKKYKRCHGA